MGIYLNSINAYTLYKSETEKPSPVRVNGEIGDVRRNIRCKSSM